MTVQNNLQVGDAMYNRYIPQPDGSFKRKMVQEERSSVHKQRKIPDPVIPPDNPDCEENELPKVVIQREHTSTNKTAHTRSRKEQANIKLPEINAGTFLRNLIPKNLDTGDILIIVLLLLMSGDSQEEQHNAAR